MNHRSLFLRATASLFLVPAGITVDAAGAAGSPPSIEKTADDYFGSDRARKTLRDFPSRGARTDPAIPAKAPAETVSSFKLMEDLRAEAVLHEPTVRQPVFLNFDERGRMWVVQFLQYPYPAGVKIVDFDDQFHAVYDKVPPPPPKHDRGADKITIHEDRDGDGTFETHKVFLDGLNMVTAVERGRGGVWVLNPPYLVFWPDGNSDDVPDGDPTIHLAGFGLEDTHSAANSLCWGPDGWLYGGQGSGVSSRIVRPDLEDGPGLYFKGQVIWRYHPETRAFELFAEGGGNTFGLEFDAAGRAWSGINGGNHRGFHFVPGGYYSKNFGEHGFFTNPHTFGYFSPMRHAEASPRFSHTFVIYEGGALGERYEGRLIAPVPLHHHLILSELTVAGSTYSTRDLGKFLESDDRWFRPVDIKTGPDGAVYLADWYDTRLTHMDPRDTWDRAHGRIYRVARKDHTQKTRVADFTKLSSAELLEKLAHPNKWFRQTALRVLADRRDRSVAKAASAMCAANTPRALDALWALHASGGFDARVAEELLSHQQALVRGWTVRLIGDMWGTNRTGLGATSPPTLPPSLASALESLSRRETEAPVQSQLASTAKRLPGEIALRLIFNLAEHEKIAGDPHIPLLLWWALEAQAVSQRSAIVAHFENKSPWTRPVLRDEMLPRLARFYASLPTAENQQALAALLGSAPEAASRNAVVKGINEAFKGRAADALISSLEQALDQTGGPVAPDQLALAVRRKDPAALGEALAFVAAAKAAPADRIGVIEALGESQQATAVSTLLEALSASGELMVRQAALKALGNFATEDIADEILARWSHLDSPLKRSALALLSSRKSWALRFVRAAGSSGTISKADIPDEVALRLRLFGDKELNDLIDRYFGKLAQASTAEKQKRIETVARLVRDSPKGDARSGKQLFSTRCGSCHALFGEGANTAPDLTGAERTNLENMLLSIVDPSVAIREGFTLFELQTKDDRHLIGFITEREGNRVTLRDLSGQVTTVAADRIAKERAIPTSIMPEALLDPLSDREIIDLFAYLMSPAKL